MATDHTPQGATAPTPAPAPQARHFRNKSLAALLAALLGWTGAHWWYLGRRHGWAVLLVSLVLIGTALRGDPWYFSPAFFLFVIPVVAGCLEALVICLTPNDKFDARYNAGHARRNRSGWLPILIAIPTLLGGTIFLLVGIVLMFQHYFESTLK